MLVGPGQHGRGHGGAGPDADPRPVRGVAGGGGVLFLGTGEGAAVVGVVVVGHAEEAAEAKPERVGGHLVAEELSESGLVARRATAALQDRRMPEDGVGERREELDPAVPGEPVAREARLQHSQALRCFASQV